jgi:cell division protein FtsN
MPRNVDGEFEVLLGNKQLLSVFFIVVILFGVFFTMGYVLGRHSVSGGYAQLPSRAAAPSAPAQPSGFSDTSSPASAQQTGPAETAPAAEEAPAKTGTQPQQQMPAAEPPHPAAAPRAAAQVPSEPAAGQVFLQATAAKRQDAEVVASVLKQKGFPVVLAPGPTDAVLRVLVGPFSDSDGLAKARAGLEAAGFKPFLRKY